MLPDTGQLSAASEGMEGTEGATGSPHTQGAAVPGFLWACLHGGNS